ncbi:TetR/AcrR family transcriptional regulator [Nocardia sp. 2]|uniref:TetR/AcrR family transcriptional regulator n=1 Tax=Nocardia acididurans TaxID=2802282 RepID=A0ABS1MD72_9NOCA|nr:TetR/AcrR family transcriptional regulator [Nocardia acididurans]MBL1078588.1 TetR/AcrR family transcriptional regulator [Nocardia acididurans]
MSEDRTAAVRRRRSPRGEGHQLRADLIRATIELLEDGVTDANLSMRAVARRAGVAATTVYLHFADREELLWAVSETLFAELADTMDAAAGETGTPAEELRARARAYCRYGLAHPGRYRVLFALVPTPKTPRALPELPGGPVFGGFESAVRRALPAATSEETVRATTVLLWSTLHGLVGLRAGKPQFPWQPMDELADAAVAALTAAAR